MKLIVAGPRDYFDAAKFNTALDNFVAEHGDPDMLIQGGARGVDSLAAQWAALHDIPMVAVDADWNQYGRRAGPMRNIEMSKIGDTLFAVDHQTRGTQNMIRTARKAGLKVFTVDLR